MSEAKTWFDDPVVVAQLPWPHRVFAQYGRFMQDRNNGLIRGGRRVLQCLESVNRHLGGKRYADFRWDGRTYRLDLFDYTRLPEVLKEAQSRTRVAKVMQRTMSAGDTFLDIGANQGTYAVLAAHLVGKSGLVHAFEPNPGLIDLIRDSLGADQAAPFTVHPVAVSDRVGEADFFMPIQTSGRAGLWSGFSADSPHQTVRVRLDRLDNLLTDQSLPGRLFVKIDVEGSELAALRGGETIIRRHQPMIFLEINPWSAKAAGTDVAQLLELLVQWGYADWSNHWVFPQRMPLSTVSTDNQHDIVVMPPWAREFRDVCEDPADAERPRNWSVTA